MTNLKRPTPAFSRWERSKMRSSLMGGCFISNISRTAPGIRRGSTPSCAVSPGKGYPVEPRPVDQLRIGGSEGHDRGDVRQAPAARYPRPFDVIAPVILRFLFVFAFRPSPGRSAAVGPSSGKDRSGSGPHCNPDGRRSGGFSYAPFNAVKRWFAGRSRAG